MSALAAVQAALVARLEGIAPVYDGAPPRAPFPYILLSDSTVSDWSTKTAVGREIRLGLSLWDDGDIAQNLRMLMIAVEAAMDAFPRDLPGWRVASLIFLRSLTSRDPGAPAMGLIEYRIRLLAT